jgi:hypothetical protein
VVDALQRLSRRRWPWVAVALLVAAVVVGPQIAAIEPGDDVPAASEPAGTTATPTTGPGATTSDAAPPTTAQPRGTPSDRPATTSAPPTTGRAVPSSAAATSAAPRTVTADSPPPTGSAITPAVTLADPSTPEVSRTEDAPNAGQRYPERRDARPNDQERVVGGPPARLSGYSAWVVRVSTEPEGPDGAPGPFTKVLVRLVNRDDASQPYGDEDWLMTRPDGVAQPSAYATPVFVTGAELVGNGEAWGELWFPAPLPGRSWLAFRPDEGSARGIWAVDVERPAPTPATTTKGR